MFNSARATLDLDALSMHHDLWVELATIEMTTGHRGLPANDVGKHAPLEQPSVPPRRAKELAPA